MNSRYRIKIGGKFFEVEIGDISSSPVEVKVDGVVYSVDMDEEIGRAGTAPTVQQPSSAHTTNVPGDVPHPSTGVGEPMNLRWHPAKPGGTQWT